MKFVTAAEMRGIEEQAFRQGIEAESLMETAGRGIAMRLVQHFPSPGHAVGFLGKGHNAGDVLVALRCLHELGWSISLRASYPPEQMAALTVKKWRECPGIQECMPDFSTRGPLLLLDGLLGIGGRPGLSRELMSVAEEMQRLRQSRGALVVAVDLPSGLCPDSGVGASVRADLTLAIAAPKRGFLADGVERSCGRVVVVPVNDLPPPDQGEVDLTCPESFSEILPLVAHDRHKGTAGRLGIMAGAPGMTGAARLSSASAVRAGAGLVSLWVPGEIQQIMYASAEPEVMVRVRSTAAREFFRARHDALVIGPGLGTEDLSWLEELAVSETPAVLDADALNGIAQAGRLDLLRPWHVLTPHPLEFRRLAPDLAELPRLEAARVFTERHACTLLLKGARTVIAGSGDVRWNPTGHAGMANGGQGDVLSGVIGAFLAGGLSGIDAASLAAWVCGRAGERAAQTSPITPASEVIHHLGAAMLDWRERRR
jgi:ADP-dependent NAD(P)H-hydrate dehydratase / NAD(P)H-hydrate epimerase